jgi:zinc transport system substrate-binding protein
MRKTLLAVLLAASTGFFASGQAHALEGARLMAYVSILPQAYFVQRVGGEMIEVKVLVGKGQSHETYEPTPSQISSLARADVYFTIGVPFEKALVTRVGRMFPNLDVVDTSKGVKFMSFAPGSGEHGRDPHVWLDPGRVKVIARAVCSGLKGADPGHAGEYDRNLERFLADLDDLDAELSRILEPVKGETIYVFHPAFGYFCSAYGLRQVAFEAEGKEPSARQMAKLIEKARAENVKVIFVQPQFSGKAAASIARSIGGGVVTLDPLPEYYPADMRTLARTVRDALAGKGKG